MCDAIDELSAFVTLVHTAFDEHNDARTTCMQALGKSVNPKNAKMLDLAAELKQVAKDEGLADDNKEEKGEESGDESDANDEGLALPVPPANPADPVETKSSDEEASTQEWGHPAAHEASAPSTAAPAAPASSSGPSSSTRGPQGEPYRKKSRKQEDDTSKCLTLELALIHQGLPAVVRDVIVKMKDDPASLDWNSTLVRKVEKAIIFKLGLPMAFSQRGPPGPKSGGPSEWGGQAWRENRGRWGNRGGKNKEFYNWYYGRKK